MIANLMTGRLRVMLLLTIFTGHSWADKPANDRKVEPTVTEEQAKAAWKDAGVYHQFSGLTSSFGDPFSNGDPHRSLRFSGKKVTDEQMRFLPVFADLTEVRFSESTQITDESLEFISQLPKLSSLHLASSHISGPGLQQLAACKNLRHLRIKSAALVETDGLFEVLAKLGLKSLALGGRNSNDSTFDGIEQLTTLRSLTLNVGRGTEGDARVSGKTFSALAPLTNLQLLEVMGDDIRQHAAISSDDFSAVANMSELAELTLSSRLLTDEGMRHIAKCKSLTSLAIWHAPITDKGIEQLSPLTKLTSLHLYGTKVTGTGLRVWATDNGEKTSPIQSLSLIGRSATNQGMFQVARLRHLSSIRLGCPFGWFAEPGMKPVPVSNHGIRVLFKLPALTGLNLGHLDVTDAGLAALGECGRLQSLDIRQLPITDQGLKEFGVNSNVKTLKFRDCDQLTRAGLEALNASLDRARIEVVRDGRQIGTLQSGKNHWC